MSSVLFSHAGDLLGSGRRGHVRYGGDGLPLRWRRLHSRQRHRVLHFLVGRSHAHLAIDELSLWQSNPELMSDELVWKISSAVAERACGYCVVRCSALDGVEGNETLAAGRS